MLRWMRRRLGGRARGGLGALLNGADELWHATAVRGREDLDRQHRHTVPAPSPGDRLYDERSVVLPRCPDGSAAGTDPDPPR